MPAIAEKSATDKTATNGANGANSHAPHSYSVSRDELIAQLYREPGKAEIVGGKIVPFMATGRKPGYAGDAIMVALWMLMKAKRLSGIAVGDNKGFLVNLPNRKSFSPDAAYYEGHDSGAKFYDGAPRFAAEVRSENDYGDAQEIEMRDKRRDYFAAGTQVVWDVDVLRSDEIVRKYTKAGDADTPVAIFRRGENADAEPTLPGFTMPVDDLFAR